MTSTTRLLVTLATAAAVTALSTTPTWADDTELFVGPAVSAPPSRPNILFIVDTSGSMDEEQLTQGDYIPTETYSGSCSTSRLYWSRTGSPPDCSSTRDYISTSAFVCNSAQRSLSINGYAIVNRAAQWQPRVSGVGRFWRALASNDSSNYVECEADAGIHGVDGSSSLRYARNGSSAAWQSSPTLWPGGETGTVHFYSGNYLNHRADPTQSVRATRLDIVRSALRTLLNGLEDNVNVGLMRYSNDNFTGPDFSDGGMVMTAMGPIETNRDDMITKMYSWEPAGSTPSPRRCTKPPSISAANLCSGA